MRRKGVFILAVSALLAAKSGLAVESGTPSEESRGQDLHLAGRELVSYQQSTGRTTAHILVLQDRFSMSIGANQFHSDNAVVWLEAEPTESRDQVRINYEGRAYLQGNVSVEKGQGAEITDLSQMVVEDGQAMVVRFRASGGIFVTAEKRVAADPRGLELYGKAVVAIGTVEPEAAVPRATVVPVSPREKPAEEKVEVKPAEPAEAAGKPEKKEAGSRYPVNISPIGEAPIVERTPGPGGTYVATVIGRCYLSQRQEKGGLLELQFDNAVIWYSEESFKGYEAGRQAGKTAGFSDFLSSGVVRAIYVSGDVVMTEGQRTIQADELFYDFEDRKALAVNAVMRNFDSKRGIPIYVRAAKLQQLAENKFAGDDITITTSEFYLPQISLDVSKVIITDTTPVDEQAGRVLDSSYDAQMYDTRMKMDDTTIFYWPFMRSNLQRPDIPLKSIHTGHDSDWGALVESRWHLSRLLGVREPEGTESTFALDYYGKRGVGSGVEVDYSRDDHFGSILGYMIHDSGKDDLGRDESRRNLEPPRELRGRFRWQHRQFLPYNWQLTNEVSYASDEHFIEGYYRSEFNVGKEQETLVHLKRIEDNWGLSLLGKVRINDFVSKLEELPSVEHHLTGQSFLEDKLTFYNDGQVSRFRNHLASSSSPLSQEFFTFATERAELDVPIAVGKAKVVPFAAGTFGYEDGSGFWTDIDGRAAGREDMVWMGEAGVRASSQYWKAYPNVRSELWDLNQLRHIIRPYVAAVDYTESDSILEQRDTLSTGISQRLQTRRGCGDNERTVDWMRLDMDVTWVKDSGDASSGPDQFIWNKPFIPLVDTFGGGMPPRDRRSSNIYGPRRNYFGADYVWRMSDTTAVLGDMNFDIQSGVVQQFDIGFSRLRWPDLSYYVGSRYLRRIDNNLGEKGSNAFTFAATYVLDPRYTVVFSQQFDFDYGANIRSDITLIRRYHRVYWGITYSADESLKKHAIVFSIWPQGVPELAIGPRKYMGVCDSASY